MEPFETATPWTEELAAARADAKLAAEKADQATASRLRSLGGWGFGCFGVWGLGFGGLEVEGFRFRVSGCRIWGFWIRVRIHRG